MGTQGFELNEIVVDAIDLVLDPNNPRIQQGDYGQNKFVESELVSDEVQNYVRGRMTEKEYDVQKLIESMRSNGFVNIDSIFVKRLETEGKFLVLEGNRRTTAIKYLLENPRELKPMVSESLKKIPVKELICNDPEMWEDMTSFILSIRHLGGVKDWAPMQQAYSIYSLYMREMAKQGSSTEFRKNVELVAKVSSTLNQDKKDVWKALRIFVAFDQLKKNNYLVKSDHYSLLDLAVNHYPSLRSKFFEVTESNFQLTNRGLERFNKLCVEENCKIKSPPKFKDFYHIFKNGTEDDLKLAIEGDEELSGIRLSILNKEDNFCTDLEDIKNRIGGLVVGKYNQTQKEKQLIAEIKAMVDQKLASLIS